MELKTSNGLVRHTSGYLCITRIIILSSIFGSVHRDLNADRKNTQGFVKGFNDNNIILESIIRK